MPRLSSYRSQKPVKKFEADLDSSQRTAEEIEAGIATTKDDATKTMDYFQYTYQRSFDIMGEDTPDYARYRGYLIGKDLYPDIEGFSSADFVRETLDHGLEPMYEEHSELLRATSSFVFNFAFHVLK